MTKEETFKTLSSYKKILEEQLKQKDNAIDECIELVKNISFNVMKEHGNLFIRLTDTNSGKDLLEKLQQAKGVINESN